jgi:hypothetical protein
MQKVSLRTRKPTRIVSLESNGHPTTSWHCICVAEGWVDDIESRRRGVWVIVAISSPHYKEAVPMKMKRVHLKHQYACVLQD